MKIRNIMAALTAAVLMTGCGTPVEPREESSAKTAAADSSAASAESRPDESSEEGEGGLYDTSPISEAYLSGDPSSLDELQRDIYDLAAEVLDTIITDGMTDYDKELAVHDYIVTHAEYDTGKLSIFGKHGKNAENPYGALAEGKCICRGYTTTFQMFMDMLEIPCRSINAAANDGDEHAWNMVQLNGHWYYVDVTWDDPIPDVADRPVTHKYFNVSEEVMASRHIWDSSEEPPTDSMEDSYIAHNLKTVHSPEEIYKLMEQALSEGTANVYFEPSDRTDWSLEEADGTDSYSDAESINSELSKLAKSFGSKHKNYTLRWQRIAYEDRVIVGVSMTKSK